MSSSPQNPRILLIGFGPTTRSALDTLLSRWEVAALLRDEDDDVAAHARRSGVPVERLDTSSGVAALVARHDPDCVVVSSYNRILPADVLDRCPFVNVHYSPLPRYRGRANVNWAIINHESHAAVTVHSIVPGLDAGGVLAQVCVPIEPRDTVGSLYDRLNGVQGDILPGAVARRLGGDLGDAQDEAQATYGCTRLPGDGEVDWTAATADVDALIRALGTPYPDAFTFLGLERVAILEAEPSTGNRVFVGRVPGRVVGWSRSEGWSDVLTGDGVLRVKQVRVAGETRTAASVLNSSRTTLGLRSSDLLAEIAELRSHVAALSGRPPHS